MTHEGISYQFHICHLLQDEKYNFKRVGGDGRDPREEEGGYDKSPSDE